MDIKQFNPFSNIPKVVFFDLCGTLIDSKKIDHEAINYTLQEFNKEPWNVTRKLKDPSKSMKDNFPNFFGDNATNAYNKYINYLIENIHRIPIFEQVYEHLRILSMLKSKTVIITNRDKKFIETFSESHQFKKIKPYISYIFSADDIGETKPSPKVIEYVLKRINETNLSKSEIFFVGDALADMNTALTYKCTPILLTTSSTDITNEFLKTNQSRIYTANSHEEIIRCLMIKAKEKEQSDNIMSVILSNKQNKR